LAAQPEWNKALRRKGKTSLDLQKALWRVIFTSKFGENLSVYGMSQEQFWRHGEVVSLAAEELWNLTSIVEEDLPTCILAALLHDVGKLLVNHCLKNRADFLVNYVSAERLNASQGEQALIGASHAELGGLLLERWGFADSVVGAVRFHHQPDLSYSTALSFLVLMADLCAHSLGESFGWGALSPASINETLDTLGVEWNQVESVLAAVKVRKQAL
jgi:HD-like signal output (HDOD) protein